MFSTWRLPLRENLARRFIEIGSIAFRHSDPASITRRARALGQALQDAQVHVRDVHELTFLG
jgi:hypothetical protein